MKNTMFLFSLLMIVSCGSLTKNDVEQCHLKKEYKCLGGETTKHQTPDHILRKTETSKEQ